jgi:hypothetical protein
MGRSFGARELMMVLDYYTWLKFKPVIKKAQGACQLALRYALDDRRGANDGVAAREDTLARVMRPYLESLETLS